MSESTELAQKHGSRRASVPPLPQELDHALRRRGEVLVDFLGTLAIPVIKKRCGNAESLLACPLDDDLVSLVLQVEVPPTARAVRRLVHLGDDSGNRALDPTAKLLDGAHISLTSLPLAPGLENST